MQWRHPMMRHAKDYYMTPHLILFLQAPAKSMETYSKMVNGEHNPTLRQAIAMIFSNQSSIALNKYHNALDIAFQYEVSGRTKLSNSETRMKVVQYGSATVGSAMGVGGGFIAYIIAASTGVAGAVSWPAAPLAVIVGAVVVATAAVAAPGLTIASLTRPIGRLFVNGLERELYDFFYGFSQPLAQMLLNRGCKSELKAIIENVSKGVRAKS
jgi:hypothetical protein